MKKLAFLFFAMAVFYPARANIFIVTSNADSGPGTLRDAITQANANGTSISDTITFNIPNNTEAGRTINLQSVLPVLSSNITIDGSTQPGATLGISDAKITLYLDHITDDPFVFLFIQDAFNINIYGLCFKYFGDPDEGGAQNYAVYLRNSNTITVGAPGKGNLFSAVYYGVTNNFWNYYNDATHDVTIKSNVFGLSSTNNPVLRGSINLLNAQNITIGGSTAAEGNVFIGAGIYATQAGGLSSLFFTNIQNNRFDVTRDGTMYFLQSGSISLIGNVADDTSITKTSVINNVLAGESDGGITLSNINNRAVVTGNKIGTDVTGTICKGAYNNNLSFFGCKKVIVGGYTADEQNIIASNISTQTHGVNIIENQFGNIFPTNTTDTINDPYIKIVTYDNGLITGRSNAHDKIQLYTNTCYQYCINRKYLTTTYADAAGNWSFPYTPDMPNIIANATMPDSSTSPFTQPIENHLNFKLKQPTCGKNNGSITGIVVTEGTVLTWYNTSTLQVLGHDTSLLNVPEGGYGFTLSNGANGCATSVEFVLYDQSPPPSISCQITNASCGQKNGNLYTSLSDNISLEWLDANYDSVGSGYFANKLAPGVYYAKAWITSDTSCNKLYGPFEVQNQSGPSLNTDNIQITASTCSNSNGSIAGIIASNITGTPFIEWVDSLNRPVGNNYDLSNVLPGKYRLKFKDASGCDTILTSYYTINDNGLILIDTSQKIIIASKCAGVSGSIQQIKVTGGGTFQWTNTSTNAIAGSSLDLLNVAPGSYQLQISNQYGCSKTLPAMLVPPSNPVPIAVRGILTSNAICGQPNGFIKVVSFSNDSALFGFYWKDSTSGQVIGTGTGIGNLGAGSYRIFAKDTNGCEMPIYTASIQLFPPPTIDYSKAIVTGDDCNLHQGSITGLTINGLTGPTVYTWLDQLNNVISNNLVIQNAAAGTYTLKITDDGICNIQSTPFTINNTNNGLTPPAYDNLTIPRYSDAQINIKNAAPGSYSLSVNNSGTPVLQQNNTGNFVIPKISADTSFYIQRMDGDCMSDIVKVDIKVVDKSFFAVATAFTPNGDGKNDLLHVKVIGFIQLTYFRIFNRWGHMIFETHNINDGWDGRINGVAQETSGFMWTAQGKDINGNILSSKGSFILIR